MFTADSYFCLDFLRLFFSFLSAFYMHAIALHAFGYLRDRHPPGKGRRGTLARHEGKGPGAWGANAGLLGVQRTVPCIGCVETGFVFGI